MIAIILLVFPDLSDNTQTYETLISETIKALNEAIQAGALGNFQLKPQPVCALANGQVHASAVVCPPAVTLSSTIYSNSPVMTSASQVAPQVSATLMPSGSATPPMMSSGSYSPSMMPSESAIPPMMSSGSYSQDGIIE